MRLQGLLCQRAQPLVGRHELRRALLDEVHERGAAQCQGTGQGRADLPKFPQRMLGLWTRARHRFANFRGTGVSNTFQSHTDTGSQPPSHLTVTR